MRVHSTSTTEHTENQAPVVGTSKTPVDSLDITTTSQSTSKVESTSKTVGDTISIPVQTDDGNGEKWEEVVSKSRKPGTDSKKSRSNNTSNGASVSAVMSSEHVDAERSVRKLRVTLTLVCCGNLKQRIYALLVQERAIYFLKQYEITAADATTMRARQR